MDLSLLRSLLSFLIGISALLYSRKNPVSDVPSSLWKYQIARNISGTIATSVILYGAKYLPIFLLIITYNTSPFWAALISYFLNGEVLTRAILICMLGCFTGICLIAISKSGLLETTVKIET